MHDWNDQRVLVTGASGFIGSHLVPRLIGMGCSVHTIQRNDKASTAQGWQVDLNDEAALNNTIGKIRPSIVFHTAASRAEENWRELCDVNIKASMVLLEACKTAGVSRLVTLGSSLELLEVPPSAFAASRSASALLMQYHAQKMGLSLMHLRAGYVYGHGMAVQKFIPSAIRAVMRGTELAITPDHIKRNYIHVNDVIDACLEAALADEKGARLINAFADEVHNAREIIDIIAAALGKPAVARIEPHLIRDWDQNDWAIGSAASQKLNGWHPRVSLKAGLLDMIDHARCTDGI